MNMYVVKNNEGKYWEYNLQAWGMAASNGCTCSRAVADAVVDFHGGRVIELVEAPAKVAVSEDEAKMLERAKVAVFPAHIFDSGAAGCLPGSQDRLIRAYVNGWTVEKPKRYLIKVPHTDDSYFYKIDDEYCNAGDSYHLEAMTDKKWFTAAEIEHYGLQDCERVEATDDEQ